MKSEVSRNVLLIVLAVNLQRLVKSLPNKHISPMRISRKSLAESYLSEDLAPGMEAARKKAGRYMDEMQHIFGLKGSEDSGYVMNQKFDTFRDMFAYWLEKISPPGKSDKRLHVMLSGLIHAIDNAFSADPLAIPNLSNKLKNKYRNKNIRDTREPLDEMFNNAYIANWLQLCEADDDVLYIDTTVDPLLLRLRPRSEVGGNADISIPLAHPGRIHVIFDHALADLDQAAIDKARTAAKAVAHAQIWQMNEQEYLPYMLYREGDHGPLMLTMRNLSQQQYEDIVLDEMQDIPGSTREYIPYDWDAGIWAYFRRMTD